MHQFFVEPVQIHLNDRRVIILGEDVNHIRNVLRMKPGEELNVSNGEDGREYRCAILALEDAQVLCELRFVKEAQVELPSRIHLFQGLPKGDKMECIIQKCVELGVYQIIPVAMKRCVVKLDGKKAQAKVARWQGIAQAAAKQSKRGVVPEVTEVVDFVRAMEMAVDMDVRLLPYELAEDMGQTRQAIERLVPGQSIAIFIGPEGGFDEAEVARAVEGGALPVTLGRRILRTETAGMTVLAWLVYRLEGIN